ncbi:MAG: galactokinase [Anaerolineae bacterium]
MVPEQAEPGAAPAIGLLAGEVVRAFRARFGYEPQGLYQAPGRVNLIGEHTDYNDGFVLPMAIDRAVWVAAGRGSGLEMDRPARQVRLLALSLDRGHESAFSLDGLAPDPNRRWSNYARGPLALLDRRARAEGHAGLGSLDLVYAGDVPIGAGLSSSAAVEVAVATAAAALYGLDVPALELARLCQQAEHEFAGTRCGLMDQLISVAGQEGQALLIDCRTFTWQAVPLPPEQAVVVCDTGLRRGLAGSAYNERRAQCEEAAQRLGVPSLRDLDPGALEARAGELPPLLRKRAQHVVYENERTRQAAAALQRDDVVTFGRLMNESHASLRDLYEVSGEALDLMAALARSQPGCYGARMTGAGFGGCAVALVEREVVNDFIAAVAPAYERQTRTPPALYATRPAAGAGPVDVSGGEA